MENKILIYDDNCPFCSWYSGQFVKFGLLPGAGRKAFSSLEEIYLTKIDFDKSRNEIPLLDTNDGKVLYGIDALLEILGKKIPWIKSAGNLPPVKWFLKKLYKLVSYNRKVIVARKCGPGSIDCSPDNNYWYRFYFMALSFLFNTLMLFPLHATFLSTLSYYRVSSTQLQGAHLVFVAANCLLAFSFSKQKAFEYLGQVNILALTVILLLIPLMCVHSILPEWCISLYLAATAAIVFKEYIRRMEYAGVLPKNKWVVSMNLLCMTGFILFLFH